MSKLAVSHVICGRLGTFAAINRILVYHTNSKTGLWTTEVYWKKDGLKFDKFDLSTFLIKGLVVEYLSSFDHTQSAEFPVKKSQNHV